MIRNILRTTWFCLTSLVVLCFALIKALPSMCESLRIKAEQIEQATKDFNAEQTERLRRNQR